MPDEKHPHDHFFKAVFSKRQVILDYIRQFLPKNLWQDFDLRTLKLSKDSFVDEKLQENLSDLVYTCIWKGKDRIRICLLLEHKSYPVKYPHVQLLRYMVNIWEADLALKAPLKPILPILFYHGKKKWYKKPFEASFEEAGKVFQSFIPKFDYHLTDLSHFPDEFILGLKKGFLINSFLVMKHQSEQSYILNNVDRIFIYEEQFLINEQGKKSLQQILTYIIQVTDMDKKTLDTFSKLLNTKLQAMANTTYDNLIQEGKEIGLEQEREIIITNIIRKSPQFTDDYIAELTGVSLEEIGAIRKKITTNK